MIKRIIKALSASNKQKALRDLRRAVSRMSEIKTTPKERTKHLNK